MNQLTFTDYEYIDRIRTIKRYEFFNEMNDIIP